MVLFERSGLQQGQSSTVSVPKSTGKCGVDSEMFTNFRLSSTSAQGVLEILLSTE